MTTSKNRRILVFWKLINKDNQIHEHTLECYEIPNITKKLWEEKRYKYLPEETKKTLRTILTLSLRQPQTNRPRFPQSCLWALPRDILLHIFYFIF